MTGAATIRSLLLSLGAYTVLLAVLVMARLVTGDVMRHIDRFGVDAEGKRLAAGRALFDFYVIAAAAIVAVVGSLGLVSAELFVALLVAILTGLGIKLTADIRG